MLYSCRDCEKFSFNGGQVAATAAFIATYAEVQLAVAQVRINYLMTFVHKLLTTCKTL